MTSRYTIDPATGCFNWIGTKTDGGYGKLHVNGKKCRAHRVAYELHIGPIPPGRWVLHRCDNPACMNPEHLFLGTCQDNVSDRDSKDRQAKGAKVSNTKLTDQDVLDMRASSKSISELAADYGMSYGHVSKILLGREWRHLLPPDFVPKPLRYRRTTKADDPERAQENARYARIASKP